MSRLLIVVAVLIALVSCGASDPPPDRLGAAVSNLVVTMTCAQETTGCSPVGYRNARCSLAGLKPKSWVRVCVQAACPDVWSNHVPENCFDVTKVAGDGTAYAWFSLLPDASYTFEAHESTHQGALGDVLATAGATLLSSVGVGTQCGEAPPACL